MHALAVLFFGFWQFMAVLYTIFLLPETRGVPIEEAANFVRAHWFWRKVATPQLYSLFVDTCVFACMGVA